LAWLALASGPALAQNYPDKPIRVIASQGPGGLSDVFVRALAAELGPALGSTMFVENHSGADGSIGAKACADAPPDGYTICILNGESMVINPLIYKNMSFDPLKDLAPITRLFYLTQVFAVTADLHVKSFPELAALAKAKPKTLNYMAPSLSKVAFMEAFNKKNGTDIVRVPFKGGGDAVNSMLSGTTQITIIGIGNVMQFLRSSKIVGLAVDGDKRSPLMPDIPTFKELGFTVHVMAASFAIHAPAGTPKPIIDKLNKAIVKIGSNPDFQKRFMTPRGLVPVFDTPEQFAKQLQIDKVEGHDVVVGSGLYPDVK
jgi:tripartite-type tricarboxylate transporter receptor subunit TctC